MVLKEHPLKLFIEKEAERINSMERIICLLAGYLFGLIPVIFTVKHIRLISVTMEVETPVLPMPYGSWGQRQEQWCFLEIS